jgi:hypothetical protein
MVFCAAVGLRRAMMAAGLPGFGLSLDRSTDKVDGERCTACARALLEMSRRWRASMTGGGFPGIRP